MKIEYPVIESPVARPAHLTDEYKLVFDEEFDGDTLDMSRWNYNYTWGNTHNHAAYCAPENVIVSDGCLTLLGERKRHPDSTGKYGNFNGKKLDLLYTGAAINTHGKCHFTYGYFEASLKIPRGRGMWPAWWMLSEGWPPEIDMMEILGSRTDRIMVNCHFGNDYRDEKSEEQRIDLGFDSSAGFHVYGLDWTRERMIFYIDGKPVGHPFVGEEGLSQCRDMYMILNLAIDGWDGTPDDKTPFPAKYMCDYVRVWQRGGE
ncbi:MAG: glycoside hydrolase family 16 protein [Clostridia bacterium]|nr:glycoside hydrolase family 16 protein [Clostridia bacterium]